MECPFKRKRMEYPRACKGCGEMKSMEEFPWKQDSRSNRCRPCYLALMREKKAQRQALRRAGLFPPVKERAAKSFPRTCIRCAISKDASGFRSGANGRTIGTCRQCLVQLRRERYNWHKENSTGVLARYTHEARLRAYGLTQGSYHQMVEEQGGRCFLCRAVPSGRGPNAVLHIDHCHDSGQVRGLLCHGCNAAIGHFRDDPLIMEKAAAYVKSWARKKQAIA